MDMIEKAAQKLKQSGEKLLDGGEERPPLLARQKAPDANETPDANESADANESGQDKDSSLTIPSGGDSKRQSRRENIDLESLDAAGMITPFKEPTQIAEEFRVIKRSLLAKAFEQDDDGKEHRNMIMVSSAKPGEGKTFCAINLALSIASERDLTVLLVDADFAKPSVLDVLGLTGEVGLVDVIDDENIDLSDCLIRTNLDNLAILPAGRHHNLTTELLASERMREIVDDMVMRYSDRVLIFDSPPVLASSAPGTMAAYVGQILFIVEAERTTASEVKSSLMQLSACRNISIILNKSRLASGSELFSSYYGYYYGYGHRTA